MDPADMLEVPEAKGSGYYLFGRDVMAIPCFRDSALAGFAAGFGVGIIHFLLTSHGQKSFQLAQFAFIGVMFPYAFYCQNQRYKQQEMMLETERQVNEKLQEDYILTDNLEFASETWG